MTDLRAGKVFELRIYHAAAGKMQALHERFRNHTCKLFEKHGMTLVGFWSPVDPVEAEKKMFYLLAYPGKESAEKSWQAFREDPEWVRVKSESEKDGALVEKIESIFLDAMDYSPMR